MKTRVVLFLLALAFGATACSSYSTCATYAKNTKPAAEKVEKAAM